MFKDCNGYPFPVFAEAKVDECSVVKNAIPENSVFLLKVILHETNNCPLPGQFYMLHSVKSNVLLGRPISVFHAERKQNNLEIQFLILVKGKGTQELCDLEVDDKINLLGPLGNTFQKPQSDKKVAIIGGGIGVAPVAGFAENLTPKSYDFFASFKSGKYGLENIEPNNLFITTDDGSEGIHGMLSACFTEELIKEKNYSEVFACGPSPMLSYVKNICEKMNIQCYLSMEARMACGVGVCLGCSIDTTEGKKRCCKEGPVFDSKILIFPKPNSSSKKQPLQKDPDLSFSLKNVKFNNPVIASSGTFGFGSEYSTVIDINKLGGISSKGLTLESRQGNDGIRLWETPSGLLNSIGLQNPGIPHFIQNELPMMLSFKPTTIANLSGSDLESYVEGAKLLEKTKVPVIELNISCPNVSAGGAAFGMTCEAAETVVKAVRKEISKPLLVKLTPQAKDINSVALKCIESGADGISLCNSFQGIAIDIDKGKPVFDKIKAGFGGPAVRPIAVRLIWELYEAINSLPEDKRVPIFAIGGIATWQDAVEFIMAGATAIQVGTNTFANPYSMIQIIDGLSSFMKQKGYNNINEICGIAHN
ncbi:MAG: dihydroorotate dehydrogenase [Treponema sp.]|jgi:dihydroorotate dehydrogenase subfamily 1|nr:dihydroorotate dehydrogenase [Treponema sp.]